MDTGDIIAQKQTEVCGRTGFMLNRDIMELGVRLFKEQFEMIMSGRNDRMPQDNRMATCNTKFSNNLRYIDWCQPAESIINHVRAHAPPYACSLTTKKEKVIRIEEAVKYGGERNSKGPGSYKRVGGLEYIVQTHTTPVKIVANVDDCPLITKGRFNSGVPE